MHSRIKISVIIPTYNFSDGIGKCLTSLSEQDFPHEEYEVITVDDGSKDGTQEILRHYGNKHTNFKVLLNHHNMGVAESYNRGLDIANGKIIVMTEQDCTYPKDYLRKIDIEFQNQGVFCVQGTQLSRGKWGTYLCEGCDDKVEKKEHVASLRRLHRLETKNLMLRRELILKYRLDESITPSHDIDLAVRLENEGTNIKYVTHIFVYHHADNLGKILARGRWYGRGQAKLYLKYRRYDNIVNKKLSRSIIFNMFFYSLAFLYWLFKYRDIRGAFARAIMRILMSVYYKEELKELIERRGYIRKGF